MSIGCTGGVFEEYVPPEGDGKVSIVSTTVSTLQRWFGGERKGTWGGKGEGRVNIEDTRRDMFFNVVGMEMGRTSQTTEGKGRYFWHDGN